MNNADFNARMDRLTERHEALTQSMELTQREIVDLKETARLLLEVAQSHQHRIQRLEEGKSS
jgi:prefoldin subunit 5